MTTLNDNLFGQTYDRLQTQVFGGTAANFQMLGTPILYNFGTAGAGQMDPSTYQIVSQMPVWSPVGAFSQDGTTLFSAYRQLLQHVTFKVSDAKAADLARQKSQISDQQRKLNQAYDDMTQAYNVQTANGGAVFQAQYPTLKDWLAGPGKAYSGTAQALIDALNTLNNKYAQDLANIAGGDSSLNNALTAIQTPSGTPATGVAPAGWIAVADSGGTLRWQPEFVLNKDPSQVRQDLTRGSVGSFTVNLSASKSSASMQKSWAEGSASRDVLFFSINAGGSWEKLDIDNDDTSISVDISVQSSMLVPVSPGVWYDGGFLKNLAQNTSTGGYQLSDGWTATGSGDNTAFGMNGLVSTNVASLILVYKPKVTVTMSQQTYQRNYEKIQASGGISIGPFSFGGSGGTEKDFTVKTNGSTSFTVESTSSDPQIIGAGVGFPGVGSPAA
ncbi:MAG: hypothetical protein ABW123_01895 [Cystobacter sp.]